MIVTVNSQRLAAELRLLCKIVPNKPAIQILSHVLLKADEGALKLWATDLEIGLVTICPGRVDEGGTIALPAARFLALVEQFPDADVSLALAGPHVMLQCGGFKSRLQASPGDDFPETPTPEGIACTLDMKDLCYVIKSTRFAVAAAGNKYILRGALLTLSGDTGAMVGTDSKRLAFATMRRAGADVSTIVPTKALDVLVDQNSAVDVTMTVGGRHLFFQIDDRLLISRTIDGEYPNWKRIIPQNDKIVSVGKDDLAAALRRITLVAEESRAVFLDINPGYVELSSSSSEVGSANERIVADYEGTPLRVCVNGQYVLDFLNASSGQTTVIELKDARSAMLIRDGNDHLGVIMLLRT